MALGVPQVMTHAALEGLEAEDGRDAIAASDPGPFADAVVGLLQDPEKRARIAQNGRRFAEAHFDWERNLSSPRRAGPLPRAKGVRSSLERVNLTHRGPRGVAKSVLANLMIPGSVSYARSQRNPRARGAHAMLPVVRRRR